MIDLRPCRQDISRTEETRDPNSTFVAIEDHLSGLSKEVTYEIRAILRSLKESCLARGLLLIAGCYGRTAIPGTREIPRVEIIPARDVDTTVGTCVQTDTSGGNLNAPNAWGIIQWLTLNDHQAAEVVRSLHAYHYFGLRLAVGCINASARRRYG